eukprot:132697_1
MSRCLCLCQLNELIALFDQDVHQTCIGKVVFITMEFIKDTIFSGNGVYARTMVSALLETNFKVLVICASNTIKHSIVTHEMLDNQKQCQVLIIPVCEWKQLNWKCDYHLFGTNFLPHTHIIEHFHPNHLLFVDYSSLIVVQNIMQYALTFQAHQLHKIFLNFRVFHNNSHLTQQRHKEERDLYIKMETTCCALADVVVALNRNELSLLKQLYNDNNTRFCVLHPPLNQKVQQIASQLCTQTDGINERKYFLCCCRISREKNVEIFIECVELLQDFLRQNDIFPYLCGSASAENQEYLNSLYNRLKATNCESKTSPFMTHKELCVHVYDKTLLNLHPSIKEPYGMVIVECAAFAVPSVTHKVGVGANELLKDAAFVTDMTDSKRVAQDVKAILQNTERIQKIGDVAKGISLDYNVSTFAQRLKSLIL